MEYLEARNRLLHAAFILVKNLEKESVVGLSDFDDDWPWGHPPSQEDYKLDKLDEDLLDAAVQFAKLVDDGEVEKENYGRGPVATLLAVDGDIAAIKERLMALENLSRSETQQQTMGIVKKAYELRDENRKLRLALSKTGIIKHAVEAPGNPPVYIWWCTLCDSRSRDSVAHEDNCLLAKGEQ